MRLTQREIAAIVETGHAYRPMGGARLYLHGSRIDDQKRGGDIDLVMVVRDRTVLQDLRSRKHAWLADLHSALGEQRIDLGIISDNDFATDPFWSLASQHAVLLAQWP